MFNLSKSNYALSFWYAIDQKCCFFRKHTLLRERLNQMSYAVLPHIISF